MAAFAFPSPPEPQPETDAEPDWYTREKTEALKIATDALDHAVAALKAVGLDEDAATLATAANNLRGLATLEEGTLADVAYVAAAAAFDIARAAFAYAAAADDDVARVAYHVAQAAVFTAGRSVFNVARIAEQKTQPTNPRRRSYVL